MIQGSRAVALPSYDFPNGVVWFYRRRLFWSTERLPLDDVQALLDARELKKQRAIGRAKVQVQMASAGDGTVLNHRAPIPEDVKLFVWQRDGGACVRCGDQAELEFDHIIPVTKGGSSTARNLQLLRAACNKEKGGHLV